MLVTKVACVIVQVDGTAARHAVSLQPCTDPQLTVAHVAVLVPEHEILSLYSHHFKKA